MDVKPVLTLPEGLELVGMALHDERLIMAVVSTQLFSPCPLCGVRASRVHSSYQRQVADLPCGEQPELVTRWASSLLPTW
ncbi:MAG TPA: transposase family protein [Ktedonobacteraceae bacterium]|nr:transposase family protein [Ktedonobacteraceae bacterium]